MSGLCLTSHTYYHAAKDPLRRCMPMAGVDSL